MILSGTLVHLVLAWSPVQSVPPGAEPQSLRLAAPLEGELLAGFDQGSSRTTEHRFRVERAGRYHVSAESYDFDVRLAVLGGQRGSVVGGGDTGVATNEVLAVDLAPGELYTVRISAERGRGGTYWICLCEEAHARAASVISRHVEDADWYREMYRRARRNASLLQSALYRFNQGQSLHNAGLYQQAEIALRDAVATSLRSGSRPLLLYSRTYLGATLVSLGKPVEGVRLLEDLRASVLDDEQAGLSHVLLEALGRGWSDLSRFDRAAEEFEAFLERAVTAEHQAIALSSQGVALGELGRIAEAWEFHEQALRLEDRIESPEVLRRVYREAGSHQFDRGNLDAARIWFSRALEVGGASGSLAAIHGSLALIDLRQGHIGRVRRVLEELQDQVARIESGRLTREIRKTMARIAIRLGDLETAFEIRTDLLSAARASGDPMREAQAQNDLAVVLEFREDWSEARAGYERALQLARTQGEGVGDLEVRVALNLGRLLQRVGEPEDAKQQHTDALALARKYQNRFLEAAALDGLAADFMDLGDRQNSKVCCRKAIELYAELRVSDHSLGPLATLARLSLSEQDLEQVAVHVDRAAQILGGNLQDSLNLMEVAGLRSRFFEWNAIAQDLAAHRVAAAGGAERDAALRRGFQRAQDWKARVLLEGLPARRELSVEESTGSQSELCESLSGLLGKSRALIEYVGGEERLRAYVLHEGVLTLHDLGQLSSIESAVARYVDGMTAAQGHPLANQREIFERGQVLYKLLLAGPLGNRLGGLEGLVIVPTGQLARLPFGALVVGGPGDQEPRFATMEFVADRLDISYGPSSAWLAASSRLRGEFTRRAVLLFGDPVGPEDPSHRLHVPWGDTTREELVKQARRLAPGLADSSDQFLDDLRALEFSGRKGGSAMAAGLSIHLGESATRAQLSGLTGRYHIAHLATHGFIDLEHSANTGLLITADAGSNHLLGLDEVVELGLDADLVILSACSTARGRLLKGEGVQSMAYAFLRGRARFVIGSLWDASDIRTFQLIDHFYELHFSEGLSFARALRKAQSRVRRVPSRGRPAQTARDLDWTLHPYYWAPYIFVGCESR